MTTVEQTVGIVETAMDMLDDAFESVWRIDGETIGAVLSDGTKIIVTVDVVD